jgi:Ala-tRNA(Pro) deacylase
MWVSAEEEATMESLDPSATAGVASVTEHLDGRGVSYDLIEHAATFSAFAEAVAVRVDPAAAGKTLVLREHGHYSLVVLPADRHLDIGRVRELTGATHHLRLATEAEMARDFPLYEVGAVPPIGPQLPQVEIVDLRLLDFERDLFAAGDHRHALLIPIRDLLRATEPRVADVCAAPGEEDKDFHR